MKKSLSFAVPFHLSFFKVLLACQLTVDDLQPDVQKSIRQICLLDDDIVDELCLTFSTSLGDKVYELVENGEDRSVNHLNKFQYLQLLVKWYLGEGLPLRQLVLGFQDVCPWELLSVWTPTMLQVIFSGSSNFEIADLIEHSSISAMGPSQTVRQWLFKGNGLCVGFMPTHALNQRSRIWTNTTKVYSSHSSRVLRLYQWVGSPTGRTSCLS